MIAPWMTIPDQHGRWYDIVREMGAGGQGTVFEARERRSQGTCVVKVYHSIISTHETAARVAALVGLSLPARSPALYGPFSQLLPQSGVGAVQMMAPGQSLEAFMQTTPYNLIQALGMAAAFCRALAVLEKLGVAHGDIAASNLMVNPVGPHHYAVSVIDFDNALIPGAPAPGFRGQDLYSAHELLTGAATVSLESDRFALAVLLHELIFLRHPFASVFAAGVDFQGYVALLGQIAWPDDPARGGAAPTAGHPVGVLSHDLHDLFRRALQPVPASRPTADAWVRALEGALGQLYVCGACKGLCVNEATRYTCPRCGHMPGPLALEVAGKVIPLNRMSTTIGRGDVGGDPTVSRSHVVVRRWGFGLRVRNTSLNGRASARVFQLN